MLSYLPVVLLALTYASHGIMGMMLHGEHMALASGFNFGEPTTSVLVIIGGLMDTIVAVLLLFKSKFLKALRCSHLFCFAGIWPVVPRVIEWYLTGHFPWVEFLVFAALTLLTYYLHLERSVKRAQAA